jgi:hypothetical protein
MSADDRAGLSPVALSIVTAVYSCRFLTAPQIAKFTARDLPTTQTILNRLTTAAFLAGVRRPTANPSAPDTVYALAQRGADAVASHLGVDRGHIRWKKYHNLVGLPFVEHRLAVNDVRIAFTTSQELAVEGWWYELPIKEDIYDPAAKAFPLSLRPDAYIRCLSGSRRLHFFLEVDLGTETYLRFAQKVLRYIAYKRSGWFRQRWGGRSFRVLTVGTTGVRTRGLRKITEKHGGEKMFWFATLEDILATSIHTVTWWLAGGAEGQLLASRPGRYDQAE